MNSSAREIQQDVEAFLIPRGEVTIQEVRQVYPEYSITQIRLALVYLERIGKALQKRSPDGETSWVSTTVPSVVP